MYSPLIRVLLRYGLGAAAVWGLVPDSLGEQLSNDPDVVRSIELAAVGIGIFFTEWWWKRDVDKEKNEDV